MVFFTLVIIVKYFLHTEPCPLFDDAVASSAMLYSDYQADESNVDSLKGKTQNNNLFIILTNYTIDKVFIGCIIVAMNSSEKGETRKHSPESNVVNIILQQTLIPKV
jgi:hypothetical protein